MWGWGGGGEGPTSRAFVKAFSVHLCMFKFYYFRKSFSVHVILSQFLEQSFSPCNTESVFGTIIFCTVSSWIKSNYSTTKC